MTDCDGAPLKVGDIVVGVKWGLGKYFRIENINTSTKLPWFTLTDTVLGGIYSYSIPVNELIDHLKVVSYYEPLQKNTHEFIA